MGYSVDYFVDFSVTTDLKNSSWRVLDLDQPGLGMSREYLIKGMKDEDVQVRKKFEFEFKYYFFYLFGESGVVKGLLNFEFSILFSYLFGERVPVKEIEFRIRTWVYLYIFVGGKRPRKKI